MLVKIKGLLLEKKTRTDKKTGDEKYYLRLFQRGYDIQNIRVEFETYNMYEEMEEIEIQCNVRLYQFDNGKAMLGCKEVA